MNEGELSWILDAVIKGRRDIIDSLSREDLDRILLMASRRIETHEQSIPSFPAQWEVPRWVIEFESGHGLPPLRYFTKVEGRTSYF